MEATTQAEKAHESLSKEPKNNALTLKFLILKLFSKSVIIFRNISHLYKEVFQVQFVRNAILKYLPPTIVSSIDTKKFREFELWSDFVQNLVKYEKEINPKLNVSPQVIPLWVKGVGR